MGSFYGTCSLTGLTLVNGSPTYAQLILPTWSLDVYGCDDREAGCGEKGMRVSNDGALAEFVPFGFPIEGKYYDYGSIDNIVRDKNVEMLEEFFDLPIDRILDCASDSRNDWKKMKAKNVEVLKQLTYTYFRKEHYDFLSTREDTTHWWKKATGRLKAYETLLIKNEKKARFVIDKSRPIKELVAEFNDIFCKREYSRISDKDIENENVDVIYGMMSAKVKYGDDDYDSRFYISSIAPYDMFKLLPITVDFMEQIAKQYRFIMSMYGLNKTLVPSICGSQDDYFGFYTKFHKLSVEVASGETIKLAKNIAQDVIEDTLGYEEALKDVDDETKELIKKALRKNFEAHGVEFW